MGVEYLLVLCGKGGVASLSLRLIGTERPWDHNHPRLNSYEEHRVVAHTEMNQSMAKTRVRQHVISSCSTNGLWRYSSRRCRRNSIYNQSKISIFKTLPITIPLKSPQHWWLREYFHGELFQRSYQNRARILLISDKWPSSTQIYIIYKKKTNHNPHRSSHNAVWNRVPWSHRSS